MADPGATSAAEGLGLAVRAEGFLAEGQIDRAVEFAQHAAARGPEVERAWRVLARASDAQGDHAQAFGAYRRAIELAADPRDILAPMGRMALLIEEPAVAENVLTMAVEAGAGGGEAILDLAWSQIRQSAFDRAQATLTAALEVDPAQPRLWLTLGEMLCLAGRCAEAVVFFEEAIRLDPASAPAHDGLAQALFLAGDDRGLREGAWALALATAADRPGVVERHGRRLLAAGMVKEGLDAVAAWLEPGSRAGVEVAVAARPWAPGQAVEGRLLVIGEEALDDEILFAHVLPTLADEVPDLILAIRPQWRGLAERSFPGALVVPQLRRVRHGRRQLTAELESPHVHAQALVGGWTTLRSLLRAYPGGPAGSCYLQADPRRVARWTGWLAALGPGLKVGVRWRSERTDYRAWRRTPPLSALHEALSQPGLCVVPLQEAEAEAAPGPALHPPPGLDGSDLDDVAALSRALDLVVGAPEALTYAAAASGAETWFLAPPRDWALLGRAACPWLPKARVFACATSDDWAPAAAALSAALGERART